MPADLPPTPEMLRVELQKLQAELEILKGRPQQDPEALAILKEIRETLAEIKKVKAERKRDDRRDEPDEQPEPERKITLW